MKSEEKRDGFDKNHSFGFSVIYYAFKKIQDIESKLIVSYKKLEDAHTEVIASEEALRNQYNQIQLNKEALRVSEERFRLAIEGSNDGIWDWDINADTCHISLAWAKMLGFEKQDIFNYQQVWMELIHPEDVEHVLESTQKCVEGLIKSFNSEFRIRRKDEYIWILSKGKMLFDENGKPIRMVGSHTDITQRKNSESKIYQLAYYDDLTELPNKVLFMDQLNASINNSMELNERGALFFIDIDNFKNINDTYGHNVGDNFLKEVAARLKIANCDNHVLARHGGDEFIVMGPNIGSLEEVHFCAKKMVELFNEPWTVNGQDFFATMSMGITIYPDDGQNTDELLKNADMAMYKAKDSGKNNYQFYEPSMYITIMEKTRMEKNLRKAIDNSELTVYYQPQVGIKSEKLIGMEALVRWNSPEEGLIFPDQFIPLAEETGLIIDIGKMY